MPTIGAVAGAHQTITKNNNQMPNSPPQILIIAQRASNSIRSANACHFERKNMRIVFLKTATSGLPNWRMPSEDPSQPVIVELAYQVWDGQHGITNECILDNGIAIAADAAALHGLDQEKCAMEGVYPDQAIDTILREIAASDRLVGFNVAFDIRMLRIMAARVLKQDWENPIPVYDVMQESASHCRIPSSGRGGKQWKNPTLGQAYLHFFGEAKDIGYRAGPVCEIIRQIYEKMNPVLI
jgi:DNA polymerase III epsilon subunit-like protein